MIRGQSINLSGDQVELAQAATDRRPRPSSIALALLFISALPDAMIVPMLKELLVDRYGAGAGPAHLFMAINVVGAIAFAGVINTVRERIGLRWLIVWSLVINAALLALMAAPVGLIVTFTARFFEGAADVAVYASLFTLMGELGPRESKGRRMGAAATALMTGIATGLALGGFIGRFSSTATLAAGAALCVIAAAIALAWLRSPLADRAARGAATIATKAAAESALRPETSSGQGRDARYPLWPALMMMFGDRAVAALLATSFPLYLAAEIDMPPAARGGLIGSSMLMLALGAWPMGWLVDRAGALALRLIAGAVYAGGAAAFPAIVAVSYPLALMLMIFVGVAGAALFAASLTVIAATGRGAAGMALYQAAGNAGFLSATILAGAAVALLPDRGATPYFVVAFTVTAAHALATIVSVARMGRHPSSATKNMNLKRAPAV